MVCGCRASGPRRVGITAGVLYGAGTFLAGFTDGNLPLLYLTYGVIAGVGLGLGYIVPIATLVKWFPDKRGLITGIAVAGFGCGALVFGPLARTLITAHGPFVTFRIFGGIFFVARAATALLLRNPPAGRSSPRRAKRATSTVMYTLRGALRTGQWYALWLLLFLSVTAGISLIAEAAPMAEELGGASEAQAAALVGTIAIFNGAGRFAVGCALRSDRPAHRVPDPVRHAGARCSSCCRAAARSTSSACSRA